MQNDPTVKKTRRKDGKGVPSAGAGRRETAPIGANRPEASTTGGHQGAGGIVGTLYVIFFVSGAAGLMYESIWSRYLGLFVGHSAYAQVIVIVIFLGGMCAGAMVTGARSTRIANPLFAYAIIELIVGVLGLAFHGLHAAITRFAYASIFPALAGTGSLTVMKWSLAGVLILPQSLLLGATFPLMSASVLRLTRTRPGRVISLLYFTNSLGGAIGVLLAGFYLVETTGLPGTITAAGILNLLAAMVTLLVSRTRGGAESENAVANAALATPLSERATDRRSLVALCTAVAFGTGAASFMYEIAWIRMLALVLGSATHSFELILSSFIFGLALGSFCIRTRADELEQPLRTLGTVQWVMGFLALATLPVYASSFEWTAELLRVFARSDGGYVGFTLARYAICLAVMLPATFCAGMTLPLLIRVLLGAGQGERAIGAIYGWNTLGSIVGVVLASLVLLPAVGLHWVLIAGALLDMGLGALLLGAAAPVRGRLVACGAAAAALLVAMVGHLSGDLSPLLLTSGVYRTGTVPPPGTFEILYYRDGRTASISAVRRVNNGDIAVATNGKFDASLETDWFRSCDEASARKAIVRGDSTTQTLGPLVTLAHAPRARHAAVIGQGSGMWSHFVLASPTIESLATVEIEPQMIEASRIFYPANRRVFDDPRSTFVIDDARSYFASSDRRFDLILSEPSNPWVSGVSGLFTAEFYNLVRDHLTDDGVLGQWLHLYEMRDGLVLSILSAIHQSFPSYRIFVTGQADLLVVAGKRSALPSPDWSVFTRAPVTQDLCAFLPFTPATLDATFLIDRAMLAPLLDARQPPNSDYFPVLDLGAERARFLQANAQGFTGLGSDRFAIDAPFSGRRIGPLEDREAAVPNIARVGALSMGAALRDARVQPAETEIMERQKLFRLQQWTAALAAGEQPPDWKIWTLSALEIERDLNGGTAGTVSESFFERAYAFINSHGAPLEAWDALRFRHGLASWNFDEVIASAARLVPMAEQRNHWIDPDELRAGTAVAHLLRGNSAGAREVLGRLESVSTMSPDDVRVRLLYAFADRADAGRKGPRTAAHTAEETGRGRSESGS